MTVDLSPLVGAAVTFAGALLPVIAGAAAAFLIKHLHVQNSAALAAQINQAAQNGAGLAARYLKENAGLTPPLTIHSQAVAVGVEHVVNSLPGALAKMGVTPDTLARMVAGKLGVLEASAPKVIATQGATAQALTP